MLNAPPIVRDLIDLHIRSHKSDDGALFHLAKSLEIVAAFFQGNGSRASRNTWIEREMTRIGVYGELTQSIEWMFNIANERFDVRHAWDKDSPGVVLHPRMTDQEKHDFTYNADLVTRAFICERLGNRCADPVAQSTRTAGKRAASRSRRSSTKECEG